MGCWGATRECFRSCGKGPQSEHYDAWLARERLRQLNAQTERNDKLQKQIAQMEMVVTQTQDILASYRDLDAMEADRVDMARQPSLALPVPTKSLPRVAIMAPDPQMLSRRTSQSSADGKAEMRAKIQLGSRQMQENSSRARLQDVTSADLDADDWRVASVAKERSRTFQAREDRRVAPSPSTEASRGERQAAMDKLRQPMPQMPTREFKFTPPAPIGVTPKVQQTNSPFAAKDAGAAAFASTHGYPAPQADSAPAKP